MNEVKIGAGKNCLMLTIGAAELVAAGTKVPPRVTSRPKATGFVCDFLMFQFFGEGELFLRILTRPLACESFQY